MLSVVIYAAWAVEIAVICVSTAINSNQAPSQIYQNAEGHYVVVLGIAQDGGYPQAGCRKDCCVSAWEDPTRARWVVSLAIVDPKTKQRWLIECTPDFKHQLRALDERAPPEAGIGLDGIFITHAHIGHYTGLMHLGREVVGAQAIPVYAMPRLNEFLRTSGPWSQLVELNNISLRPLVDDASVALNDRIRITPIAVPHRKEYSETVAFRISGPRRSILFLPDIDKWDRWERRIEDELTQVDVAYLDATFFDQGELPGRNMAEIPHPFVVESIDRFQSLDADQRGKVRLIHFNHTNPLLRDDSPAVDLIDRAGLRRAAQFEVVEF